jgi:hypothetical protein
MATIQVAGKAVTYPARLAEPYFFDCPARRAFFLPPEQSLTGLFPLDLQS